MIRYFNRNNNAKAQKARDAARERRSKESDYFQVFIFYTHIWAYIIVMLGTGSRSGSII